MLGDDVFIHFLEHEIVELVGRAPFFSDEARHAFRMSLLVAERTVVPATAYWEDAWAAPLLEAYAPFRQARRLQLIGTAASPEEYLANKREQYARDPTRYRAYFEEPTSPEYNRLKEMWRTRVRSTTADIGSLWRQGLLRNDVLFAQLLRRPRSSLSLEAELDRVPEWLGTAAFIGDFVIGVLDERGVSLDPLQQQLVGRIITRDYVRSFLDEMGATALLGGPTKAADSLLADSDFTFDVQRFARLLAHLGLQDLIAGLDPSELLRARESLEWEVTRQDLLGRAARSGPLWTSEDYSAVRRAQTLNFRDPLDMLRGVCEKYTHGLQGVARQRLREEAEMEGKRRGTRFDFSGGSHDFSGAHLGDKYSGPTVTGDIVVSGGRLSLGGKSVDLRAATPDETTRAIAELLGSVAPENVVKELEAASAVVDEREDINADDITAEIVQAFSGPRETGLTERLKAITGRIAEEAAVGAASGGLTSAVLLALQQLGLG